jgi:hypothetical protein
LRAGAAYNVATEIGEGKEMKARKIMCAVVIAVVGAGVCQAADQSVAVYVDGKLLKCTPAALVRDGVTYVPLRAAADAVKGEVTWQPKSQMAVVCRGGQCVPIKKTQCIEVGGSLLVPLKLVGTALKCEVQWDPKSKSVRISTKG